MILRQGGIRFFVAVGFLLENFAKSDRLGLKYSFEFVYAYAWWNILIASNSKSRIFGNCNNNLDIMDEEWMKIWEFDKKIPNKRFPYHFKFCFCFTTKNLIETFKLLNLSRLQTLIRFIDTFKSIRSDYIQSDSNLHSFGNFRNWNSHHY